jgi:hypothetical protein
LAAAEAAEFGTAAGCCAAAAFWSGGSLAPPGLPLVPPPEYLLPGAVAAAVLLAAIAAGPGEMSGKLRHFLSLAAYLAARRPSRRPESTSPRQQLVFAQPVAVLEEPQPLGTVSTFGRSA